MNRHSMIAALLVFTGLIAGLWVVGVAGEKHVHRGRTRVCQRCGIPAIYNYRTGKPQASLTARSRQGVLLRRSVAEQVRELAEDLALGRPSEELVLSGEKYFQLTEPTLALDHCAISHVVFRLNQNGDWTLNLRADQNPVSTEEPATTTPNGLAELPRLDFVKRNLFRIRLRGYGALAGQADDVEPVLGRPQLFAVEPIEFWVERREPYFLMKSGHNALDSRYFEFVDRVEVDFSYE